MNGGKTVQTNLVFPQEIYSQLELKGMNGAFDAQVSYRALSSIWE
nr:hypothetical protein [Anaerophaga thermohalophila]